MGGAPLEIGIVELVNGRVQLVADKLGSVVVILRDTLLPYEFRFTLDRNFQRLPAYLTIETVLPMPGLPLLDQGLSAGLSEKTTNRKELKMEDRIRRREYRNGEIKVAAILFLSTFGPFCYFRKLRLDESSGEWIKVDVLNESEEAFFEESREKGFDWFAELGYDLRDRG